MADPQRLRVAIIGGGIAGLAAARMLREAHDVTIYERCSADTPEAGAAIGLGPNGTKMAKVLGLSRDSLRAVVSKGFKTYDQSGNLAKESRIDCSSVFGSEWWMVHRQDLKDALLAAATSNDPMLPGTPAKIIINSRVDKVDSGTGEILFHDGSKVQSDFIIGNHFRPPSLPMRSDDPDVGADGIHSRVRSGVVGPDHPEPVPVSLSLYRFTVSHTEMKEVLGQMPEVLDYSNGVFLSSFIATDGSNRNVVIYPCRDLLTTNFACAVPDSALRQATENSWTKEGDVEEMVHHFHDFPPWLYTIMR